MRAYWFVLVCLSVCVHVIVCKCDMFVCTHVIICVCIYVCTYERRASVCFVFHVAQCRRAKGSAVREAVAA